MASAPLGIATIWKITGSASPNHASNRTVASAVSACRFSKNNNRLGFVSKAGIAYLGEFNNNGIFTGTNFLSTDRAG